MNTLRASTFAGRDTEVQCDAAWYGPGNDSWNRGLTLLKRKRRLSVHVQHIAGRGLLITEIPGTPDIAIEESAWNAFVGGQKEQLVASIGRLYLTFTRADLAPLLPQGTNILPFRRGA
jgi:hypothetical protein